MDSATNKTDIMMMIINSLYTTAKNDLTTSMLLFKEGKYAPALFYLQQSVEKITKYFIAKIELKEANIDELDQQLKQLGHEPVKNLVKLWRDKIKQFKEHLEELQNKENSKKIQEISDDILVLVNLKSYANLINYLESKVNEVEENLKKLNDKRLTFSEFMFEKDIDKDITISQIKQILQSIPEINSSFSSYAEDYISKLLDDISLLSLINNFTKASLLQMFLSKYDLVNNTRYPTSNNTWRDPYEYYNNEHELIVNYCTLHKYVSNIIDALGNNIVAGSPG